MEHFLKNFEKYQKDSWCSADLQFSGSVKDNPNINVIHSISVSTENIKRIQERFLGIQIDNKVINLRDILTSMENGTFIRLYRQNLNTTSSIELEALRQDKRSLLFQDIECNRLGAYEDIDGINIPYAYVGDPEGGSAFCYHGGSKMF